MKVIRSVCQSQFRCGVLSRGAIVLLVSLVNSGCAFLGTPSSHTEIYEDALLLKTYPVVKQSMPLAAESGEVTLQKLSVDSASVSDVLIKVATEVIKVESKSYNEKYSAQHVFDNSVATTDVAFVFARLFDASLDRRWTDKWYSRLKVIYEFPLLLWNHVRWTRKPPPAASELAGKVKFHLNTYGWELSPADMLGLEQAVTNTVNLMKSSKRPTWGLCCVGLIHRRAVSNPGGTSLDIQLLAYSYPGLKAKEFVTKIPFTDWGVAESKVEIRLRPPHDITKAHNAEIGAVFDGIKLKRKKWGQGHKWRNGKSVKRNGKKAILPIFVSPPVLVPDTGVPELILSMTVRESSDDIEEALESFDDDKLEGVLSLDQEKGE